MNVCLIENVYLCITEYNEGDSREMAESHIEEIGLHCFFESPSVPEYGAEDDVFWKSADKAEPAGIPEAIDTEAAVLKKASFRSFAITDDRDIADRLKGLSIGFAVYDNEKSRNASFRDALYRVDRITYLKKEQLERFL